MPSVSQSARHHHPSLAACGPVAGTERLPSSAEARPRSRRSAPTARHIPSKKRARGGTIGSPTSKILARAGEHVPVGGVAEELLDAVRREPAHVVDVVGGV